MDIFQRRLLHDRVAGDHVNFKLEPIVADGWAPAILEMMNDSKDHDILFEKASIDESYFDLSVYVRKQLLLRFPMLNIRDDLNKADAETRALILDKELPPVPAYVQDDMRIRAWKTVGAWWPTNEHHDDSGALSLTWIDMALAIAAERMISIRHHIIQELGYTT